MPENWKHFESVLSCRVIPISWLIKVAKSVVLFQSCWMWFVRPRMMTWQAWCSAWCVPMWRRWPPWLSVWPPTWQTPLPKSWRPTRMGPKRKPSLLWASSTPWKPSWTSWRSRERCVHHSLVYLQDVKFLLKNCSLWLLDWEVTGNGELYLNTVTGISLSRGYYIISCMFADDFSAENVN